MISTSTVFRNHIIRNLVSGCVASIFCLSLTPASIAQTEVQTETSETVAEAVESSSAATDPTEEFTIEKTTEWPEAISLKEGFTQGCMGEEPTSLFERRTKRNFCECAFEAYSERYSPYQFMQINALATQIGEDGILLVNLMMGNNMNACAEETGFELE